MSCSNAPIAPRLCGPGEEDAIDGAVGYDKETTPARIGQQPLQSGENPLLERHEGFPAGKCRVGESSRFEHIHQFGPAPFGRDVAQSPGLDLAEIRLVFDRHCPACQHGPRRFAGPPHPRTDCPIKRDIR